MKTLLPLLLMLAGCQTCREHPVACVATAVVVGAVAASAAHRNHQYQAPAMRAWQ